MLEDLLNHPSRHGAVSGLCGDGLHDQCTWPTSPDQTLYCSCSCHREARPMDTSDETPAVAQEIEAADDPYVLVPLAGFDGETRDVRTLPAGRWRASALRALNGGDMDTFMSLVLHEDDVDTYQELDPDMEAIGRFAEAAARAGGEDLGKSGGPRRSSRSTRKR
ncbi:hypothetical protein ACWD33_26090 [Streptomyces xiamenensis]